MLALCHLEFSPLLHIQEVEEVEIREEIKVETEVAVEVASSEVAETELTSS